MTEKRTAVGLEVEEALKEALAFVRGEQNECAVREVQVNDVDVAAIRKRLGLSRPKFAQRFGLDARAVQDWEQRRRRPDRAARVLLKVIDKHPEAVEDAIRAA
jgi:putative transcriptional regulator